MKSRQLYLSQHLKNFAFNARYNLLGLFEQFNSLELTELNSDIHILGETIRVAKKSQDQIMQELLAIFKSTPWLTYRSGFPELPNEINGNYVTDTGWGCMIRVGQMLFATILRSHHIYKHNEVKLEEFLQYFNDHDKKAVFSIQRIAKLARIEFNIKPGDWYNPSQISFLLSELHRKQLQKKQALAFIVFNSGSLFYDQLISAMLNNETPKQCTCQKEDKLVCEQCNKPSKSIAIIILCRLGLKTSQVKYLQILQQMMKFKAFRGVIGGKPRKALYFLGSYQENYIYLDPHYVQQAQKQMSKISQSYQCSSLRCCKNSSIDPSVGICFYLSNFESLNRFRNQMLNLKRNYREDFFIFMQLQTPIYARQNRHVHQQEDDMFQQI